MGEEEEGSVQRVLRGRDAKAIVARLMDADTLGLLPKAAQRLRARSILLDPERVFRASAVRVALLAARMQAKPTGETWIAARIDEAIDQLLQRDQEERRAGIVLTEGDHRNLFLQGLLGLPIDDALEVSVAFNALPELTRRSFFSLCVEAKDVDACVEEGYGSRDVLRAHAMQALQTLDREGNWLPAEGDAS